MDIMLSCRHHLTRGRMFSLSLSSTHTPYAINQLSDPDAESPLNCDAGNMIRGGDDIAFQTTAKMYTVENAMFLRWPTKKDKEAAKS